MGFLIFAARKLMLKRRINDLNYRAMMLSQQKQQITEQINSVMQSISQAKTSTAYAASAAQNALAGKYQKEYESIFNKPAAPAVPNAPATDSTAAVSLPTISDEDRIKATNLQNQFMGAQTAISMASQMTNSIFEAASNAQLGPLQVMDSRITLEIASIDSQTKQLMPELESVEKAEDQAAKSEAPKFGLS